MIIRGIIAGAIAVGLLALLAGMAGASGAAQEDQRGRPIIVRWSTESEVDTAGFNIYRSESENGPWSKLNLQLIPGSPDPLRGGTYVFTDTNVIANQTYWYELEEVELGGQVNRLERTQATAGRQGLGLPTGLPCASILFLAPILGMVGVRMKSGASRRAIV